MAYKLPIPFKEKGTASTWLHSVGYVVDCDCATPVRIVDGEITMSGVTVELDLSTLESRLDAVLSGLTDMLDPVTQTFVTGTTAGSIPAGTQSYMIVNLGLDPNDPNTPYNPMIINGVSLDNKVINYSASAGSIKGFTNSVSYDPNGNTLFIVYST